MPPQAQGAYNAVKQALSIFSPFNKVSGDGGEQNAPDLISAYRSEMPEEELIALKNQWKRDYAQYYGGANKGSVEGVQNTNYEYWLGKQTKNTIEDMLDANRNLVDNECWVGLETFLPLATRANPEPVVTIDQAMGDQTLPDLVRHTLSYQADRQKFRMYLRAATRDWALNKIGVIKLRWDRVVGDIDTSNPYPKQMMWDPEGHIKPGGIFVGGWIGELLNVKASYLVELFPQSKVFITGKASNKMGTKLPVELWWVCDAEGGWRNYFYCLDDHILGKFKNNIWNYDTEQPLVGPDGLPTIGEDGEPVMQPIKGVNHLPQPPSPYIFVGGIYSTRTQPHDDTTPFEQALPVQDLINRRFRQIDKNAESTNNGIVVNGNLNSEQAALAAEAVRKGGAIRIPDKNVDVRTAVMRLPAPPLASTVYENLSDARNLMMSIWGISGSTPQGVENTDTVRGKILVNQLDASRIGGAVTETLEQVADSWFNLVLQFMYVYYDVPHFAAAIGQYGAQELIQLKNTDLNGKIMVTIKEGSMIPKDPMTLRNQAVDLWGSNGIDPISLGKYLEMPDPYEYAKNLYLWQAIQKGIAPPQLMFPDIGQPMQQGVGQQPGNPQAAQANTESQPAAPASNEAVAQQSSQLLQAEPIGKV